MGKWFRCSSHGWGYIGAPVAEMSLSRCKEDAEKLGYLPMEAAGIIGIVMQEGAVERGVVVGRTLDGSPAAAAGIKPGDIVVSVDGKKPASFGDALQLMFGKKSTSVTLVIRNEGGDREVTIIRAPYDVPKSY